MTQSNDSRHTTDPAGGVGFLVEVKQHISGCDVERKQGLVSVVVEVLSELGNITSVKLPWESGAFRGVSVEDLAKRLGTTPDCIIVM